MKREVIDAIEASIGCALYVSEVCSYKRVEIVQEDKKLFIYGLEYMRMTKRNNACIQYTNRVGNVCFALIKFFVQIKQDETHNLALGHPLNFINHDELCHITHVHVNKTAFVAVPLQNISDQCIYIDLGSD